MKSLLAAALLALWPSASAHSYNYGDAGAPDRAGLIPSSEVAESSPAVRAAVPGAAKTPVVKPAQPAQPETQPQAPGPKTVSGDPQAAPSAPPSKMQAAVAAAASTPSGGEKLFDGGGSKQGGAVSASGGSLGETSSASPVPVVASAPPAARQKPEVKGLAIQPTPVPEGGAVLAQTQDSAFDSWLDSMRRRASSAWESIGSGISSFAGDVKRVLTLAGEEFKKAFMAVWNAPDTKTLGAVNNGRLVNGIQLPDSPYYAMARRQDAWGAKHMILGLMYIGARLSMGGAPTLKVGDISAADGGKLGGHKSHQRGLDVDLPFFYNKSGGHDAKSNYQTLELLKNNPFMTVDIIFVSPRVKTMLLQQAKEAGDGELAAWAEAKLNTTEPGHDNHYHVRISPEPKFWSWLGGAL